MAADDLTDEELYDKLADRLIRFATSVVGPADAEDVMTDGVLAAMTSARWPRVEDRGAYLYRCVLNASRMHLRAAGRRRGRENRSGMLSERVTPVHGVPEPTPEVRRAVAGLSARQRAVIFLTYWEDLNEAATARRLGISVGSVRRHLSRARHKIREELSDAL